MLWVFIKELISFLSGSLITFSDNNTKNEFYLSGLNKPVDKESTHEDLKVTKGKIPQNLPSGYAMRIGANQKWKNKGYYHFFDGDGMIHRVHIKSPSNTSDKGSASYMNRWVKTKKLKIEDSYKRGMFYGGKHFLDAKIVANFLLNRYVRRIYDGLYGNTSNTNIVYHHGKLLALWEGGLPHEINVEDLKTIGEYNWNKQLGDVSIVTAHPKIDPRTGEYIYFGTGKGCTNYGIVSKDGKITTTGKIITPSEYKVVIMHDFSTTEKYVVMMYPPFDFDVNSMMDGRPMVFNKNAPTKFCIFPKYEPEKIKWFTAKANYVFHFSNSWEEGDEIILQAPKMEDTDFFSLGIHKVTTEEYAKNWYVPDFYEWRFNMKTGKTKERVIIDKLNAEFPMINPDYHGVKNRYVWCSKMVYYNAFKKIDLKTNEVKVLDLGFRSAGEPTFVKKTDAKNEDDGYLVSFTSDRKTRESFMVIVDAVKMKIVCEIKMKERVPTGFHTAYVTESEIKKQ